MPRLASRIALLIAACLCVAACGGSSSSSTSQTSTTSATTTTASKTLLGYENMPIELGPDLATPSTTGIGTVDGITCAPIEQLAYHIHAHLAVYVNGSLRSLPAGIGIPGSSQVPYHGGVVAGGSAQCIYWLHTHTNDGVIHIESPTARVYTLGAFFDEWRQPLSSGQVASAKGPVTANVNGKIWSGSPRAIPLNPHADIQLDIGSPTVPFRSVSWSQANL
ncbi:MAG: hypothetical protein ACR2L9_13750 [Solirubrobacteraceae bacterium]